MASLKFNNNMVSKELATNIALLDGRVGDRGIALSLPPDDIDEFVVGYADKTARRRAAVMLEPYDIQPSEIPGRGSESYSQELWVAKHQMSFGRNNLMAQRTEYVTIDPFSDLNGYNSQAPYNQAGLEAKYARAGYLKGVVLFAGGLSEEVLPTNKELRDCPGLVKPAIEWATNFVETVLEDIDEHNN